MATWGRGFKISIAERFARKYHANLSGGRGVGAAETGAAPGHSEEPLDLREESNRLLEVLDLH